MVFLSNIAHAFFYFLQQHVCAVPTGFPTVRLRAFVHFRVRCGARRSDPLGDFIRFDIFHHDSPHRAVHRLSPYDAAFVPNCQKQKRKTTKKSSVSATSLAYIFLAMCFFVILRAMTSIEYTCLEPHHVLITCQLLLEKVFERCFLPLFGSEMCPGIATICRRWKASIFFRWRKTSRRLYQLSLGLWLWLVPPPLSCGEAWQWPFWITLLPHFPFCGFSPCFRSFHMSNPNAWVTQSALSTACLSFTLHVVGGEQPNHLPYAKTNFWCLFEHFLLLFFVRSSSHHAVSPSQHLSMPVAWRSAPSPDFKFDNRKEGVRMGDAAKCSIDVCNLPTVYVTIPSFQFHCQPFLTVLFCHFIFFSSSAFTNTFFFRLPNIAFLMHRLDR